MIEAMEVLPDPTHEQVEAMHDFLADTKWGSDQGGIFIETLEGTMRASDGDWIIRGVQGEHYPCKPDIFAMTYEPADTTPPASIPAAEVLALVEGVQKLVDAIDGMDHKGDDDTTGPFITYGMVRELAKLIPRNPE